MDDDTCTECKGTGWDKMRERECDCVRDPDLTSFPETVSLCLMAKTNQERLEALRAKRAKMGLKRFELYLHPLDWPAIKKLAQRLTKRRQS
jgi:hypothetical protein